MKTDAPRFTPIENRQATLVDRRNLKMAQSSHAYVRGNTAQFYEWLRSDHASAVPHGPGVWICGDCHIGNLGPIASAKGVIDIQIRDLDQTVIGNPAHDLVRLGLSLASAARGSDLPGVVTARMIEQVIEGYEQAFEDIEERKSGDAPKPDAVKIALRDALRRKWRHLARERIEDTKPKIPLGSRFWPLSDAERAGLVAFFDTDKARRMITSLRSRADGDEVEVLDAAYWMKGCSSLGLVRYAVLIGIGGKNGELCLVDVKQAVDPVAPAYPESPMPADNGERVATGAAHLSPALGDRMVSGKLGECSVFVRELLPQDLKFEIENLEIDEAVKVARFLATVVGKAHARQMTPDQRHAWEHELTRNRTKTLDAPSWLWSSVIELVANHERAYLEHCRTYVRPGTSL